LSGRKILIFNVQNGRSYLVRIIVKVRESQELKVKVRRNQAKEVRNKKVLVNEIFFELNRKKIVN